MHWFTRSVTITITSQIMDQIINKPLTNRGGSTQTEIEKGLGRRSTTE